MQTIQPTISPARFLIPSIELDGQTAVGELTVTDPAYDTEIIIGEGDAAFLAAAAGNVSDYNPLPAAGEWCEAGTIYGYNSGAVICRQSHARTNHEPEDVPALWMVHRPDVDGIEWIAGEQVSVGTIRTYEGTSYRCLQPHVTQSDWTPPSVPSLWELYNPAPPVGAWAYPVAYKIGDRVTYQGSTYECRQAHTSQAAWTPPVVPALWLKL